MANIYFTHLFFLTRNQTYNSCAVVLLFGCSVLRYILDAQLFLQPQPTSHRQHTMGQLHSTRLWPHRPLLKDPSISQALLQPLLSRCDVNGNHYKPRVTHSHFYSERINVNIFWYIIIAPPSIRR